MKLHLPLGFLAAILATFIAPVHAENLFVFPDEITWTEYDADQGLAIAPVVPVGENWHVTGTNTGGEATDWINGINAKNSDYLFIESGNFRKTKVNDTTNKYVAIAGAKIGTVIGVANDTTDGPTIYGSVGGSPLVNANNNPWMRIESGTFYNNVGAAYKLGDQANPGTVSLIINGGSFRHDVTGVLSSGTENVFYGNVNIEINGGTFVNAYGIYGGTASDNAKFQAMLGNATLTIQGEKTKIMFAAGGNRITAATTGNPTFTGDTLVKLINGASSNGLIGGNAYLSDSKTDKSLVVGNTNILIDGGNILSAGSTPKGVVGGSICGAVTGTASITIQGASTVKGAIIGGNLGWFNHSLGNSIVNIFGGNIDATGSTSYPGFSSIANQIYGGSVALSKSVFLFSHIAANLDVQGSTVVNIADATIKGNIYGGGYAQGTNKAAATLTITGGTNISISSGEITGNIYGGSNAGEYGTSTVSSTKINITGGVIIGDVYAGGSSSGTSSSSTVTGDASIVMTGGTVTGSFDGSGVEGTSSLTMSTSEAAPAIPRQWSSNIKNFTHVTLGAGINITSVASGVTFEGNGSLSLIDGAKLINYAGFNDLGSMALTISGAGSEMILGQTILNSITVQDGGTFRLGLTGKTDTQLAILTSTGSLTINDLRIDPSTLLTDLQGKTYKLIDGANLALADGFTINGLTTGTYNKDGKTISYTIAGGNLIFGGEITDSTIVPPPTGGSSETITDVSIVEGKTEAKGDGEIIFTGDGAIESVSVGKGVDLNAVAGATISQVVVTTTTTIKDEQGNAVDQEVSTAGLQTLLDIKGDTLLTGTEDASHITTDLVRVEAGTTLTLESLTLKTTGNAGAAMEMGHITVVLKDAHLDGNHSQTTAVDSHINGSGSVKNISIANGSLRAGNSPGVMELSNIITGVSAGNLGSANSMTFQAQICNFGDNITLDGMNSDTGATGNISQFNITGDVVLGSGTVFEIVLWNDGNVGNLDTKTLESGAKFQFFTFNGGSITGEFAGMLNAPVLADGLMWDISQLTTGGFAQVIWSSIADGSRIANTLWTSGQTVANISTEAVKHVGEAVTGKTTVWLSSLNDFTRANSAGSTTGYDFNTQGYSVGAQRGIEGGHVIGLAFGNSYGTHTPLQESTHASAGKIKQDAVMGTIYGRVMLSKATATDKIWSIDAYAGYGEVSNKSDRTVNYDSSNAHAKWDDMVKTLGVQANYAKKLNEKTILTPFAGLDFIHGEQDSFTEYAKSVKASYDNGAYYNLRASLGAGISHVVEFSNGMALIPSLSASYGYDICRMNPHTDVSEAAGNYRAYGVNPGRNSFQITPALSWKINKAWSASTNYTLRTRSGLTDQSVNASVSYTF